MGLFSSDKTVTVRKDALSGDINSSGKSGLDMLRSGANELNDKFYSNPTDYADTQISTENRLLRNASADATRRTRDLIAQRGMSGSSIGLGQEINQSRNLNEKLALNNASGMDRIKGLLNEKMNTGNALFNIKQAQGPVQMTDLKYKLNDSSGKGIGALVGGVAGAYFGGPSGAAAGAQIGSSLG